MLNRLRRLLLDMVMVADTEVDMDTMAVAMDTTRIVVRKEGPVSTQHQMPATSDPSNRTADQATEADTGFHWLQVLEAVCWVACSWVTCCFKEWAETLCFCGVC